jgi:D-amino peptidase
MTPHPSSDPLARRPSSTGSPGSLGQGSSTSRATSRRIYVKVGMAGISGVLAPEQLRPGSADYEDARHMMTHDLNAVLDGAFRAGASEAVVYDDHAQGRNVNLDALDERAVVIAGRPGPQGDFFYGLDETFAALYLVGARPSPSAPHGVLGGIYGDEIASLSVNDTVVGEIGMEAALAGKFGVPLGFVSGDAAVTREARELLGSDVQTVSVKEAVGQSGAVCLPCARTARLLREAAERAFLKAPSLPPLVFPSPVVLRVAFHEPLHAAALARVAAARRVADDAVCIEAADIVEAHRTFILALDLMRANRAGRSHAPRASASASA